MLVILSYRTALQLAGTYRMQTRVAGFLEQVKFNCEMPKITHRYSI